MTPAELQVYTYVYQAELDGAPSDIKGETRFFCVRGDDSKVKINVQSLDNDASSGKCEFTATAENLTGAPMKTSPRLGFLIANKKESEFGNDIELAPGNNEIRIPYEMPNAGEHLVRFTLGAPSEDLTLESSINTPVLYDHSYGALLPYSGSDAKIWTASSGWKISRKRSVPTEKCDAVALSCAANETEAVQLVVNPTKQLREFKAISTELSGPGGVKIPAENVEILRVEYVDIDTPTDGVGVSDQWPDPLPPQDAPLNLEPAINYPLWIRAHVPAGANPGVYEGSVQLNADGFNVAVPLRLNVYGFALPDRMTCTTAFGFEASGIFRYQKLTEPEQQREVLDKYLASLAAHHVSPYNPAPLDPFKVTWPEAGSWEGGKRDAKEKHGGESSMFLDDAYDNANVSCGYNARIPITEKGFILNFASKTREAGQIFVVTIGHYDAEGKWMSGRNNDIHFTGTGEWNNFDATINSFPEGAVSVDVHLWPAPYAENGSTTGSAWFDDISLKDAATGNELLTDGGFEPLPSSCFSPTFDWTKWDAAMSRALEKFHFNTFSVPVMGMGGGTFFSRVEPSLLGYREDEREYKEAFTAYCRGLQEHLREKGWLNDAFVYWFDEPEPRDYQFVMNGFRKIKEAAPDLNRMLTEEVTTELVGGPNIWCPLTPSFNLEKSAPRMQEGDRFWWYVCTGPKAPYCTLFIDHPGTEMRVWLWQTWLRGINGLLIWHTNYWTSPTAYPNGLQNPYLDPMSWMDGYGTATGSRIPWGNGDGRFMYPPVSAANGDAPGPVLDGPVDSMRWEMLRDGIEDYEYLTILKTLIDKKGPTLSPEKRADYEKLLEVPPEITENITTFTIKPETIEARRDAVARAIETLRKES
jgi:hypothetical protein